LRSIVIEESAIAQPLQTCDAAAQGCSSNQVEKEIMHIEAIATKPSTGNQINWVTAFFMASLHIGAIASLFFFT
jgi:hypothetical protein